MYFLLNLKIKDSVEDGEKIVATAIENYGRLDILINNDGNLRDKSFLRTSDLDWGKVLFVHSLSNHLLGSIRIFV